MLDDTENKKTKRQLILSNYINKYTQEERDTKLKHTYIHTLYTNKLYIIQYIKTTSTYCERVVTK